jgi:hypothetical protein
MYFLFQTTLTFELIDLKIKRGHPLLITIPNMKYHNNLMKGSQDIERTSSGLLTHRPTGGKQYDMLLFFEVTVYNPTYGGAECDHRGYGI